MRYPQKFYFTALLIADFFLFLFLVQSAHSFVLIIHKSFVLFLCCFQLLSASQPKFNMHQSTYILSLLSLSLSAVYAKDLAGSGPVPFLTADRSFVGTQCAYGGKPYTCQMLSENGCPHGEFMPGYCPGSTNIQCCVEDSNQQLQGSHNSSMQTSEFSDNYQYYYYYTECEEYEEGEPFDRSKYFYPDDFDGSSSSDKLGPSPSDKLGPSDGAPSEPSDSGGSSSPYKLRGDGGLKVVEHPRLSGYQLVVSDYFAPKLQSVFDCLPDNGALLHITSAARSCVPAGGATSSMHMLGRAFDFNIKMGKSMCDKACLGACWRGERTDDFAWVKGFLQCVQGKGLEYGAVYSTPDPVHFTISRPSDFDTIKADFQPSLQSFCNGDYPGAQKVSVSESTCGCFA